MTVVEHGPRATPAPHGAPPEHGMASTVGPDAPAGGIAWEAPPPSRIARAMRKRPWLAPGATGVALAMATAYTAWQDPNTSGAFPGCPLREMTGWDCPGCGGLRATHALTQGDLFGALDHNIFLTVAVPIGAVLWLRWMVMSLGVKVPSLPKVPRAGWWAVGTVILVFTVLRNIPGVAAFEYLNSFT